MYKEYRKHGNLRNLLQNRSLWLSLCFGWLVPAWVSGPSWFVLLLC